MTSFNSIDNGYNISGHVVGLGLFMKNLSSLPESISNLSSLKELHIGYNQLTSLPESIGNLNSLKELHIGYNQLTSLQENINNALKKLKKQGCRIYE